MKELLDLKVRFGLDEPRLKDGGKGFACNMDFLSRVSGDVGRKGRVATAEGGTIAASSELRPSTAVQASPMEQAIHSMIPAGSNYSDADIETLVQTITDQIMASA